MMLIWKVGPALAAGNTVVLKPSANTPESAIVFAEIAGEILPPGVFNLVLGTGETGRLMSAHPVPGLVALTGSVRAGSDLAEQAAGNVTRVHLELGGKAPAVVFADADIEAAAEGIAAAGTFNAGRTAPPPPACWSRPRWPRSSPMRWCVTSSPCGPVDSGGGGVLRPPEQRPVTSPPCRRSLRSGPHTPTC